MLWLFLLAACCADAAGPIDRHALVERHAIVLDAYTPRSPLSVGNGEFAYTFDVTGMQTFPREEPGDLPLTTMAQWAWHAFPGAAAYDYADTLRAFDVHGRKVTYATDRTSEAAAAIRSNPHRFGLAQIGLRLTDASGREASADDLASVHQRLSLWTGEAVSRFQFDGQPVTVRTVAHPRHDAVAWRIESPLLASGRAAVEVRFPYPAGVWGPRVDVWDRPDRHATTLRETSDGARLERVLDATRYAVDLTTDATLQAAPTPHTFTVRSDGPALELVAHFRQDINAAPVALSFQAVQEAAQAGWRKFWTAGGAIDLSESADPRWRELERRIVLSQYVTAVNGAGSLPPQETGLVCNSWHGKSHLEMHWWHAAHFALWGRAALLERSLPWYDAILPAARAIAERQGYRGVRWPKMTGPAGVSSPSDVGELLVWQQPHPIFYAELLYRLRPTRETLRRYEPLVEATADFMADYAHDDGRRRVLGPVLIPAQESYDGGSPPGVLNPTFELAYWRWALRTANAWRERLGRPADARWREVAERIATPTVRDGVYTAIENAPYTRRRDHPSMLAALGVLPDVGLIDRSVMRRTLAGVAADWDWPSTWGWDYPMMAMTAARVGEPARAVDCLLLDTPKNHYLPNGHCRQEDRLPIYLPANGGLLYAAALMAAGWDSDTPLGDAPGFPRDGSWVVRHEGLAPAP